MKLATITKEDLEKAINAAKQYSELAPTEYQREIFQAILQLALAEAIPAKQTNTSQFDLQLEKKENFSIENFATIIGTNISELNNIFLFETNPFRLVLTSGETITERMQENTLLLLCAWKYAYNKSSVSATILKDQLTFSQVKIATTYGNALGKLSGDIYRKGKAGSTNVEYGLTRPGEMKALELIRRLLKTRNTGEHR